MPRLLLSSVCKPFGPQHGDSFLVRAEGGFQLMWAQGVFCSGGTSTQWSIDFIAQNLRIPTTTLHYPSMGRFRRELKKGYDYVGIAFVASTMHKMIPMARAVRELAPGARIILGSYGTSLPEEELRPHADHICRGEGVAFMRELLGEDPDRPLEQPVITQHRTIFSIPNPDFSGFVFAGLGCPNGCEFCATSHYHQRRYIPFLRDGQSVLDAIYRLRGVYPRMRNFYITDEDFLLNPARGRGFLQAIRASDLPAISVSILSSVKALSQYSADELVEMGIDWIWIGYEGLRTGFEKMRGRSCRELFAELRRHGINVMASMILGMDYQTPEIVQQEFDELMDLRPAMTQYMLYNLDYGTPLHERLQAEGRVLQDVFMDRSKWDGTHLMFRHPHFSPEGISQLQLRLYRDDFARLGPSVFRMAENFLQGFLELKDHARPRVRAKAQKYKRDAHRYAMLIPGSLAHLEPGQAAWADDLFQRIVAATGPLTRKERWLSRLVSPMIRFTGFRNRHQLWQQPEFTRREYRMG